MSELRGKISEISKKRDELNNAGCEQTVFLAERLKEYDSKIKEYELQIKIIELPRK